MKIRLDYDVKTWRGIQRQFILGLLRMKRVFTYKRKIMPWIYIQDCKKTKKGWHVEMDFTDNLIWNIKEKQYPNGNPISWYIIVIQDAMGSDLVRSLFTSQRLIRRQKAFNLLFDYKNGKEFKSYPKKAEYLNLLVRKFYYGRKM